MLVRSLRCFEPFARLPTAALVTLAEQARTLSLPAGRWLVRPGRSLSGRYYLQRGAVSLREPDDRVSAGSLRSRWPIYPGARGILTLSPVTLVRISEEAAAATGEAGEVPPPLSRPQWLTDGWECRFLSSGAMARIGLDHCQTVMRAMYPVDVLQGERVVRNGDPGETVFVLAAGRAEVSRGRRALALLEPGDHFGEDAAISGSRRNACVTMVSDGRVMTISGELFREVVVGRALLDEGDGPAQATIDIGERSASAGLSIPLLLLRERLGLLRRELRYRVVGGSTRQRALAAFVLLHRGFRVALAESGLEVAIAAHPERSEQSEARVAGAGTPVYSPYSRHGDRSARSE